MTAPSRPGPAAWLMGCKFVDVPQNRKGLANLWAIAAAEAISFWLSPVSLDHRSALRHCSDIMTRSWLTEENGTGAQKPFLPRAWGDGRGRRCAVDRVPLRDIVLFHKRAAGPKAEDALVMGMVGRRRG
ncbi:MAG: hypothetical protein Udaeo2_12760 [Candidatus Udaeobacter sp.]|nr:MAG: hypothetical protein Udaeo2_12760 [Candidatus Udaeobacter sp.]